MFSQNTKDVDKRSIMEILGIQRALDYDHNLVLPLLFGMSKTKELKSIEKVCFRIQNWKGRLISQARRAIMIQEIGQVIPLFAMSCFKLPKGFIHELNILFVRYWWGDLGAKRKIHWKRWKMLCYSKLEGGLDFKDLQSFNVSLLAK